MKVVLDEVLRGIENTKKFLDSKPSQSKIDEYLSCALEDRDFDESPSGKAYAQAVIDTIREANNDRSRQNVLPKEGW